MPKLPLRVTFFSYKGGAGRSVACANVADQLVRVFQRTTAIFDFDTESVGQSYIHGVEKTLLLGRGGTANNWIYVQDLLDLERHGPAGEKEPIRLDDKFDDLAARMLLDITETADKYKGYRRTPDNTPSKILLLAKPVAEVRKPDSRTPPSGPLRTLLHKLAHVDFVLFDSPSGTQPLAQLARNSSHAMVVFCRPSRQFLEGTRYFLQRLVDSAKDDHEPLTVFVVLSAVPMGEEFRAQRDAAMAFIRTMVRELQLAAKTHEKITIRIPDDRSEGARRKLVIPEMARLKWQDEVVGRDGNELSSDVAAGLAAYQRLAEVLVEMRDKKSES